MLRKLIIVCEEKLRKFGDYLAQLISLSDDKDGVIVGVKDGSVAAQVWTEKEYVSQAIQISSEQYILFIGNTKLFKEKRENMINQFHSYGMAYSWLGKQGCLYIKRIVNYNNYNDFIKFANDDECELKKLIHIKKDVVVDNGNKTNKLLKPVMDFQRVVTNAHNHSLNTVNRLSKINKIKEQEYTCLINTFYRNALNRFLRLDEEN